MFDGTTYTPIKPPKANKAWVFGVAASGELVGYVASYTPGDFLFRGGSYRKILVPGGSGTPEAYGINPQGTALVGLYTSETGFVFQGGNVTELAFPGADPTYAYGINSSGNVVGQFEDASYKWHGFLWTPPGHAEKK